MIAGDNSNSLVGEIKFNTDEVVCQATTASTAAKLSIADSSGDKIILSTQTKQSAEHTLLLPASPAGRWRRRGSGLSPADNPPDQRRRRALWDET